MYDSWGKTPSGMLYGNTMSFGNFDQCLDFTYNISDLNENTIRGQYCLTSQVASLE